MENKEFEHSRQEVTKDEHATNGTMAQKKGGIMNTLYPPGPRPGAGPRMKNHCKKFWWCDLLVTAVIILVVVLPIIYVAIPNKAQKDIDASTLEVISQEVTDTQPDQVHLKIKSIARSGSAFHPTIEAFRAGLSLEGKEPFIYVNVPEVKAEAETEINIEHDAPIANMDAFKEYTKLTMASETFHVMLSGKTKVHQAGLSAIDVDYNKRIEMKGLNRLQGLDITNLEILFGSSNELPDGSNMVGNVLIPNPSRMTLELGNVTMNLAINGTSIGTSTIPNLILRPGDNNNTLTSKLDQLHVVEMITETYRDGVLPLEISGNSSVRNGEHLPYFEAAIQSNTIELDMDVSSALQAIGLNITES